MKQRLYWHQHVIQRKGKGTVNWSWTSTPWKKHYLCTHITPSEVHSKPDVDLQKFYIWKEFIFNVQVIKPPESACTFACKCSRRCNCLHETIPCTRTWECAAVAAGGQIPLFACCFQESTILQVRSQSQNQMVAQLNSGILPLASLQEWKSIPP